MKKKKKKKKQSPTGLIVVLLVIAAAILLVRHFHIKNFHTVEPGVLYISGQPRGMDYTRLLYKYHIAAIVNIRSIFEHREKNWYNEEVTWVRDNGVKYFELPIDRSIDRADYFPDEQIQNEFLKIMADKENLPVLLHGSSGKKRVPMLTAVWLIKNRDYTVEQTLAVIEKINGERQITETERKFISTLAN